MASEGAEEAPWAWDNYRRKYEFAAGIQHFVN